MKTIIGVLLVIGLLVFQSNLFSGKMKLIASILGVSCFVGLIAWSVYAKKKKASDPAIMLNDVDSD